MISLLKPALIILVIPGIKTHTVFHVSVEVNYWMDVFNTHYNIPQDPKIGILPEGFEKWRKISW